MSNGEIYVNGIEVFFCDRCGAGYTAENGAPIGGLWITIDGWYNGAVDTLGTPVTYTICPDCSDDFLSFISKNEDWNYNE